MSTVKVEIYSTPSCHYCQQAKDLLTEYGVTYEDYNVFDNKEKMNEMRELTGQMAVPVIVVSHEGEAEPDIMVGFNDKKLLQLVGIGEMAQAA